MGIDRTLDEEGIPDLEGPLEGKAASGDPQEGVPPPADRAASLQYGTTADEQSRPEPLDQRVARELPDELLYAGQDDEPVVLIEPEDEDIGLEDDGAELVARGVEPGMAGLSAEEAAVHKRVEPPSR